MPDNKLRNTIFIVALLALLGATMAVGQFRPQNAARNHVMTVVVDSVEWRSDVSRVHCRLCGTPHTSHRIDSVTMRTASGLTTVATDIDPLYFTRAFQWEDEAEMPVEIDFAPMKRQQRFTLTFATPYGEIISAYNKK